MTDDLAHNPILFPQSGHGTETHGMNLRDWFAGHALAALITAHRTTDTDIPDQAYEFADQMLNARRDP